MKRTIIFRFKKDFHREEMLSIDVEMFERAAQMSIWRYVWRENFAETIVHFIDLTFVGVRCETKIHLDSN